MNAIMSASFTFFMLLLAIHGSQQAKKNSRNSPTYRAAVVEFKPVIYKNDSARTLNENVASIVKYIKRAARRKADIIVFPELIPITVDYPARQSVYQWASDLPTGWHEACGNESSSVSGAVRNVGCAAKRGKIYVVINVIERTVYLGRNCPHDGYSFYISSVVYNGNGIIINRYRKSHLLDERNVLDVPESIEKTNFTTDFGVTFGHITGADLFYQNPWMNDEKNLTDFIFQATWPVKMPFLTPVQMQAGFSYAKDINLLAAGYNSPKDGFTGSGIYAGRQGILSAVMTLSEHEEMLIVNVTKKLKGTARPSILKLDTEGRIELVSENTVGYQIRNESLRKNESRKIFKLQYDALESAVTKMIAKNGSLVDKLIHDRVECKFEVNVTNLIAPATYRLVAFDGLHRISSSDTLGVKICSILTCSNVTLNSCGRIFNSSTIFQSIAVIAINSVDENTTMIPNSLGTDLFPLRNWFFDEHTQGKQMFTLMYLPTPTENLISFGVWGRNYTKENTNMGTRTSSDLLGLAIFLIIIEKIVS